MSISITAWGSITIPQSIMPGGAAYLGPLDVFAFSPADSALYAGWSYSSAGQTYSVLTKIDRSSNSIIWNHVFGGSTELLTHAIVDSTGNYVYTAVHNGGASTLQKRSATDGSLVASSAASTNVGAANNPGLLRMATISSVTYLALCGNTTGLFVVRTDTMGVVLDVLDVTSGVTPYFLTRASFDSSGNLFLGGDGGSSQYSDLDTLTISSVVVSGGTVTVTMSGNFSNNINVRVKLSGLTAKTYLNNQIYVGTASAGSNQFVITGTGLPDDAAQADTGTVKQYLGNDLIKIAIPSGVTTIYNSVWPEAPTAQASNLPDTAEQQWFDSGDNTLLILDENRPARKISLATNPPSQSQVMEADYPNNTFQCEFTNLVGSATQEGFQSGAAYVAITGLGSQAGVAYSYLITIDDLLSNVLVFGQTAPTVRGALFNAGGYWSVDPSATNLQDVIADPNNNTTSGLRLWTLQPSGTATRWQWFQLAISNGPKTLTGKFQYPDGSPVANGRLYLRLSQDAQIAGGGGQVSGGVPIVIRLDASGSIPNNTTIWASDQFAATTSYVVSVIGPGGDLLYGAESFTIAGASPIDISGLTPAIPQNAGRP